MAEDLQRSGFNAGKVVALRKDINNAAQRVGETVVDEIEKGVIKPMSSAWYAEEAQEYFEKFAEAVARVGEAVTQLFDGFRGNVQTTGQEWSTATGSTEEIVLPAIDKVELVLKTAAIKAKDGAGNRYLDENKVIQIAGQLNAVEAEIQSKLKNIADKLNADTSFLGHNQGEAIKNCFEKVAEEVHNIFTMLLIGDDALSGALQKFKDKYAESATNVATSFNNAQVSVSSGK